MKLELTIQEMFNEYPMLFKERSDCLNHLFCTIGNGYKWQNGELVSNDDKYTSANLALLESLLINGKAFQHNKMSLRDEAVYYAKQILKEKGITSSHISDRLQESVCCKHFEDIPDNVYHRRPRNKRWYFYLGGYCTEYAKLFNYPEDIKPDWLAGIEECKAMLREDGYDVDNPDENPIDTKVNWEESIRFEKERIKK